MQKILQVCILDFVWLGNQCLHSQPVKPSQQTKAHKGLLGHSCKRTTSYCGRKRAGCPSIGPTTTRFCQHHFPMKGTDKSGHRCHYCHNYRKQQRETVWHCSECQLLYLCHTGQQASDCFRISHARHVDGPNNNYWSNMLTNICQKS